MKYCIFTCSIFLLHLNLQAQETKPFTLTGQVAGLQNGYIYLSYSEGENKYHTDSVLSKTGQFSFHGQLSQPLTGRLYLNSKAAMYGEGDVASFFMEPANMQLKVQKGHFSEAKLTGSKVQLEQEELEAERAPVMKKLKPLSKAFDKLNKEYIAGHRAKKGDAALEPLKTKLDKLKEQMEPYYDEMEKADKVFMDKHPNSYVTADLLRYRVSNMPLQEGEGYYARMSPELQQSMDGKNLRKELDALRAGSPGNPAYVFSKTDINGQPLSLSDFKGKYVIVDFWASWCGPCRKGNPHLKELYTRYKSKGFEVIGVSDDDSNTAAWKKAVEQDGIGIWKHVLRGLDWNKRKTGVENPEDLSDHFGIHSLPTKILIDPQGMIIGRYGGGGEDDDAMNKKLLEIFGA
ncbi:thiol-disulfide isomerase/thioredoxin [Chitinophaga niastensis]|uniref:Thiol-disulfide isomerase/thioredoxin n=1 Tax=Chitinophaga niastensis TaxID=536980 RepID=A0A2P8HNZ7_CHINA|nr:TlpA disulfide reductase family protein [Chitinophaga niastensis]PSL47952.1 thiol-disulfide isomerase/thioredoxin [Chitinophaga niastensis]